MTDLNHSLRCCERALSQADLLIAMLTDSPDPIDPELSIVRSRIAVLRREVERLRRMPNLPAWKNVPPDRLAVLAIGSPWATPGGGAASPA